MQYHRYYRFSERLVRVRPWLLVLAASIFLLVIGVQKLDFESMNVEVFEQQPFIIYGLILLPSIAIILALIGAILPRIVTQNVIIFLGLWAMLEIGIGLVSSADPTGEPEPLTQDTYYRQDDVLGHTLQPENRARHRKTSGRHVLFDVSYDIDGYGRRQTPSHRLVSPERFLIFFGGSNTFGEGLNVEQTLPYYTSLNSKNYQPYNYGVHGYGIAQMLDLVRTRDLASEVSQRDGIILFYFIPQHMGRLVGASHVAPKWGRRFSYYRLSDFGVLTRDGNFMQGRRFTTMAQYLLMQSNVVSLLGLSFPLRYSGSDFRLAARIIDAARQHLKDKFREIRFYVVLAPAADAKERKINGSLARALSNVDIEYLDYTNLYDPNETEFRVAEQDFHQSGRANYLIAQELIRDLALK